MYTLMSNKQYYDALGTTGTIANTEGINSMSEAKDILWAIAYTHTDKR